MTTPNYGSYQLLNYANDTFLLELQSKISPSTLNSAAANLAGWFLSNELVSNGGQTKELTISNAIRQPELWQPKIKDVSAEQVESIKYLSTVAYMTSVREWGGVYLI